MTQPDPTRRFSDRVENYVRFRPGYPPALLDYLRARTGLSAGWVVADVGSGTGISSELLLRSGATVHAIEPNAAMRAAAEERLGLLDRFHSLDGTAERTGLPSNSVDLLAAGQAFHWFDPDSARSEASRILKDDGWAALFWNSRLVDASPFLAAYETLLKSYAIDYQQVNHRNISPPLIERFFGGDHETHAFPNEQVLGYAALEGRLLSSSYAPGPGHPDHLSMLAELKSVFRRHQEGGHVTILYTTELYLGRIAAGSPA